MHQALVAILLTWLLLKCFLSADTKPDNTIPTYLSIAYSQTWTAVIENKAGINHILVLKPYKSCEPFICGFVLSQTFELLGIATAASDCLDAHLH